MCATQLTTSAITDVQGKFHVISEHTLLMQQQFMWQVSSNPFEMPGVQGSSRCDSLWFGLEIASLSVGRELGITV